MRRLVPEPVLSAALFALWLLLNPSIGPGNLVLAVVVGLALPRLTAPLRPQHARISHPAVLLRLIGAVGVDVVGSSLQVAHAVLRAGRRTPRSAFVSVPLELRDPHALASLAIITTVVPGTVWSELAADRSSVLLHVFDVVDEAAFIAHYKERYERPLLEIFE
jgi:multicomponent K+:H+ antiporter subunit E